MPVVSAEELSQYLASSIENVWETEWMRADLSLYLTTRYNKAQIKILANHIGRSHQDVFRWAALAQKFPPHLRRQDRSPREHTKVANEYARTGLLSDSWSYLEGHLARDGSRSGHLLGRPGNPDGGVAEGAEVSQEAPERLGGFPAPRVAPRTLGKALGHGSSPLQLDFQSQPARKDLTQVGSDHPNGQR